MEAEKNQDKKSEEKFSDEESAYRRLSEIVKTLRGENGCPWDKKQTPQSMRPCVVEEAFELVDALTKCDKENAMEELGDLFFNALMIGFMFQQKNDFSLAQIYNSASEKLLRRHPHVDFDSSLFLDNAAHEKKLDAKSSVTIDSVNEQWNKIKNNVEGRKRESVLDQVPDGFPPMTKAYKHLKKAASQGFEWPEIDDAKNKIVEELDEVQDAQKENSQDHLEDEVGDLILSVINYARLLGVNPDVALERADKKFCGRYSFVEKKMKEKNLPLDSSSLGKMEELWREAKSRGL